MVEEIPARTGKMGHFYLGFYTLIACRAVNKTKLIGRNCLLVRFHEILRFALNDIVFFASAPCGWMFRQAQHDNMEKLKTLASVTFTYSERTYTLTMSNQSVLCKRYECL